MRSAQRPPLWTRDYAFNVLGTVAFFGSFFYLLSALPDYVDSIGGAKWQVGLIVGGFGIIPIMLRPFVGRWSDRGHRKRLQRIGVAATVFALVLMVFSADVVSLFLLRVVQGLGMATFPTASASLAAELSPFERRGEGLGYFGVATSLAQMVTPALGVLIADVWGFDAVFLVAAATAALSLILVQPVREPSPHAAEGASTNLFPRRAVFPMLIFLSVTFSFSAAATFLPLLGDERGLGNVGLFFLVSGAGAITARPIAGRTSDRVGRVPVVVPGLIATCASMWILALANVAPVMWLAGAAAGLGMGAAHTGLLSYAIDRVPADEKGRATAVLQMSWDIGGLSGAVVLGIVATVLGVIAVYWSAGVIVLAATLWLLATEVRARRTPEADAVAQEPIAPSA